MAEGLFFILTKLNIMVRTVITPQQADIRLSIPEAYIGKAIEITFVSVDELKERQGESGADFWKVLPEEELLLLRNSTQPRRINWIKEF